MYKERFPTVEYFFIFGDDKKIANKVKIQIAMINRLLQLALAVLVSSSLQAQEYLEMIDSGQYSVDEIVQNAEAYFADRDKGRGSGYKQFKRWEYMANRLMDQNGYLVPDAERLAKLEAYNAYLNDTASEREVLNDDWIEHGPDDWNATSAWSPGVGRITGFAVDLGDTDHMIVSAETGGVWRTTDGGGTWTPLGDYFSNLRAYSVAIDPTDSDTYFFGSSSGLVYKSEDAGATWTEIADVSNSLINKILINPNDTDVIYISSQNAGLWGSTDGGASWNGPLVSDVRMYDIEFKPGDTNTIYATGRKFHKSVDGGATWTETPGFASQPKMMGVSPADDNVIYMVEAAGGSFGALYISTDQGDNFTEIPQGNNNYFGYDINSSGGQAPRDMDIAVSPSDINEVHVSGVLTYVSYDGGDSFTRSSWWIPDEAAAFGQGYCHADVDITDFVGDVLYVGTDGGIFKATDTQNLNADYYTDLTKGLGIRQNYKFGVSQTQSLIATAGSQDNGTSFFKEDTGEWRDWIGADGMETFVDWGNTNRMYGTSQFGQLYRSDNGGNSLLQLSEPGAGSGNWVTPFEQDPVDSETIYLGYSEVFKNPSAGGGGLWEPISQNFGGNLDEMKIAPSNNQVIYASRGGFFYRTTDGGATDWTQTSNPGGAINNFAVHPTDPLKVALVSTNVEKILITEDGGDTWTSMRLNLPDFSALSVVWDISDENGLYIGMDYGVYYIDDTFTEWQPYFNNLPNVIVNELEINFAQGRLYAATYGRGMWSTPTKYGNIILANGDFLDTNSVSLAPNPATDELRIALPRELEADIRVFDLSGKLLMYHKDVQVSTFYQMDISALQTGTYFVRVSTNAGTITKKLLKK